MKPIKTTHPKAKTQHRCDLCGEPIPQGKEYTYMTHRTTKSIQSLKAHTECFNVAEKMDMMGLDYLDKNKFDTIVRKFVKGVLLKSDMADDKAKVRHVLSLPTKELIPVAQHAWNVVAKHEEKIDFSQPILKDYISACAMLLVLPIMMDDLIYELQEAKLFRHGVKFTINKALKDIEIMSNGIWRTFRHAYGEADNLSEEGMNFYEAVKANVSLSGIDGTANIAISCIEIIREKYSRVVASIAVQDYVSGFDAVLKQLEVIPYERSSAIKFIVGQHCKSEDIMLKD